MITDVSGTPIHTEHRLNWIGIPAVSDDCPWEKLPLEAELNARKNYVPNQRILETWLGSEDLSCRFSWGWSPERIRMRWLVTDDRHFNDRKPPFLWDGDSVQIWYDGALYDLALSGDRSVIDGPAGGRRDRMRLEVVAGQGADTVYQLEIRPKPGQRFQSGMKFPFSFCVNDNDGEPTRKGWMYHFANTGVGGERKNSPPVTLMAE